MLKKYSHLVESLAHLVPAPVTDKVSLSEDERNEMVLLIESHLKDLPVSDTSIIPMLDGGLLNSIGDQEYYEYLAVMALLGKTLPPRNNGKYKNKMFSFSEFPEIINVSDNVVQLIEQITSQGMVMSVNVMFMLDFIRMNKTDIPDQILIVSDDTGNAMMDGDSYDLLNMKQWYKKDGVKMPLIVYWNIASQEYNMFMDNSGIQLVNGMSDYNLDCVLCGQYANHFSDIEV